MSAAPEHEPRDGRLPGRGMPAGAAPGPRRGRVRRAVERVLELLLVLLLTLLCFLVVLLVLDRVFPTATSLGDLMRAASLEQDASRPRRLPARGEAGWSEAVLTAMDNEVLRRRAGSVAWDAARTGVRMTDGDGVQTRRDGTAVLGFDHNDWLRIDRNSLVILKRPDEDAALPVASLSLVSGEVSGHFAGRRGGTVRVDLPGASQSLRIDRGPDGGNPSRFKVSVGRDHHTAITVYAGRATVSMGARSVMLGPNQYVVMSPDQLISGVRALPAAPAVESPADGAARRFREFPPAITFRWAADGDADLHRLVIARDPAFREVVFDEAVSGDSVAIGSLPPGDYAWHVNAVRGGIDSRLSPARRLSLVLDDVPPALDVSFPGAPVEDDHCVIEGAAESGCRLFVAGESVAPGPDGRFSLNIPLKPGTNLVVVEAVDAAGNSSYRSQLVRRRVQH
jgi:hypothetical protein